MWFYVVIIKMNKIDKIEEKGYNRIGNTLWNDLLHIRSAASTRLIVSSADEGTTSFLPSKNSVRSPGERNRANFYLPVNQASEILPELLGSPTITGVSGENNFCLNAWRDRSVEEWKGLGRATKELRGTRGGSKVWKRLKVGGVLQRTKKEIYGSSVRLYAICSEKLFYARSTSLIPSATTGRKVYVCAPFPPSITTCLQPPESCIRIPVSTQV